MRSETVRSFTAALTDLGGQRVWSLLVSVFGDLAQEKGAVLAGPVLSEIMAAMEVKPEATRVALHRLRRDGWIISRKTGRTSQHGLTARGRKETIAASARIYAAPDQTATGWQIILTPAGTDARDMAPLGYTAVMPRAWIGAETCPVPRNALLLRGKSVPDWVSATIAPDEVQRDYAVLYATLGEIDAALPTGTVMPPVSRAVLRCLIVHNWRRLLLKHPDLPPSVWPANWRGHDCHRLVYDLLARLPRPTPEEL